VVKYPLNFFAVIQEAIAEMYEQGDNNNNSNHAKKQLNGVKVA
jgi:hypothetical protein